MNNQFIMRWPALKRQVVCEKIEHNHPQFDWWVSQLPLKAVQGHVMVAGWGLSAWNVHLNREPAWKPRSEVMEEVKPARDGRLFFFMPMAGVTTVLVKYDYMSETMCYPTFAQVRQADLPILREVGALIWRAMIKTKEIIIVEYVGMEA